MEMLQERRQKASCQGAAEDTEQVLHMRLFRKTERVQSAPMRHANPLSLSLPRTIQGSGFRRPRPPLEAPEAAHDRANPPCSISNIAPHAKDPQPSGRRWVKPGAMNKLVVRSWLSSLREMQLNALSAAMTEEQTCCRANLHCSSCNQYHQHRCTHASAAGPRDPTREMIEWHQWLQKCYTSVTVT